MKTQTVFITGTTCPSLLRLTQETHTHTYTHTQHTCKSVAVPPVFMPGMTESDEWLMLMMNAAQTEHFHLAGFICMSVLTFSEFWFFLPV